MKPLAHRSLFLPLLGALIALAWITLFVWERSPYGRYLGHAELGHLDFAGGAQPVALQAGLYVAGWTLMTVAMMLPTTLPLLEIFRRLTRDRVDHGRLVGLLIAGYLAIWLAFGIAAHVFDLGLHKLFDRSGWLQANPWVFGAGPLLVAGAFQFSALKYRCLDKCRTPLSFVMEHWRGRRESLQAFELGVRHGLFCVGCCWALMLLMFAVGTGSIGWMLALGAVMAIEKNVPWGRKLSAPLGAVLLAWGALIVLNHSWSWQA
jgi:predicted metal-binding membrane protein